MLIKKSTATPYNDPERLLNRMAFWIGVLVMLFIDLLLFLIYAIIHAIN